MAEKIIEDAICNLLSEAKTNPSLLKEIKITNSTSEAQTLYDLIGDEQIEVLQQGDWNNKPTLMPNIIGGMTPDIVIREATFPEENRIIIEVKDEKTLNYEVENSQIIRYFIHLLTMTEKYISEFNIQRAIFLAAPAHWFDRPSTSTAWDYFISTYKKLATSFEITLGEIHSDKWLI